MQLFWCPRCGTTMLNPSYGEVVISVPKLVPRVVEFGELLAQEDEEYLLNEFERMGIDESISKVTS